MPPQEITSFSNPRIKRAVALRDARQRRKLQRFLIDGSREVLRALEAGIDIEELFVCPEACRSEECQRVMNWGTGGNLNMLTISDGLMERIAFGGRNEGIVAVALPPDCSLEKLALPQTPLLAVLEGVEKPGNIGAVLRSADAAGLDAVLIADGGTDLYNPNAIRASLGAIFTLPLAAADSASVKTWLLERGSRLFAARVDAEILYHQVDWSVSAALVLGSEAHGLSTVWTGSGVTPVRLPMRGKVDSLNVSAAAAVLFYEAQRQRDESLNETRV